MNEEKDFASSNQIKKINEINTDGLKWSLSLLSGGRTWYLKTKKDIVAILNGRNLCDTTMTGETAQEKWIFKTVGGVKFLKFFHNGIVVCSFYNDSDIVTKLRFKNLSMHLFNSTYYLKFVKSKIYPVKLDATELIFLDSDNNLVVSFKPKRSKITKKIWIDTIIGNEFVNRPELSLLLLIGGYIIIACGFHPMINYFIYKYY